MENIIIPNDINNQVKKLNKTIQEPKFEVDAINKSQNESSLEIDNLGKYSGVIYASINRMQEIEERISGDEVTIENTDSTLKENAKCIKLVNQNILFPFPL